MKDHYHDGKKHYLTQLTQHAVYWWSSGFSYRHSGAPALSNSQLINKYLHASLNLPSVELVWNCRIPSCTQTPTLLKLTDTYLLAGFQWSGLSDQWTLLLTEICLQCQKWCPYWEEQFLCLFVLTKREIAQPVLARVTTTVCIQCEVWQWFCCLYAEEWLCWFIGTSLSEPHTSGTALCTCMCMSVCRFACGHIP